MKHKILLILLGIGLALLFGEILFRAGSVLVQEREDIRKIARNTILCLGDSTTYGIGASDKNILSYPAQLQKLLNDRSKGSKFNVVNLGQPGINSSQLLNRFQEQIKKYQPSIVVIMIGINDPWNFEENNILQHYKANGLKKFVMKIELMLNRSKLYRFFKLIIVSKNFDDITIPDFNTKTLTAAAEFFGNDSEKAAALSNALVNNITQLKKMADENNIICIFMKYHNIGWGRPELVIHHAYEELSVPVVDNEGLFKGSARRGLNVLSNDNWHPGDLGYSLIAKNVYNKMVEMDLVDSEPVELY